MKKYTYRFLIFLFILLILSFFFEKDIEKQSTNNINTEPILQIDSSIPSYKNVTIDNIDYIQSQLPLGKFGGTFTQAIISDPKTFNPYNSNDTTSGELCDLLYDGLLQTNPTNGKMEPKLAKSFKILDDKKTYIINLRKRIKWTDGQEITAQDVYYTYKTVIFEGFGSSSARDMILVDGKLPKIEILDKYTIKFTTPKPFAPFLRNLSLSILPKHIFEPITNKGNEAFLIFQGNNIKPESLVTSGAFKLKEYLAAQRVVLEKNPNYYLINTKNQKLPYLNKLVMLIVSDTNNSTLKFESGATDVLSVNGSLVNRYRELKKHNNFELYNLGPTSSTTFIFFNLNNRQNKEGKFYVDPVKQKWFQDKNFRSAIDWAIDRNDLILNIFSGIANPLYTAEAESSFFLNKKIAKGHPKNINKAKELLIKSGFYYKNNELYDKEHNRVKFELLTNAGNTQREATGVSIKQDLEKIGIKVNYKAIEFNSLVNKIASSLDFDCIIIALNSNILEPHTGYNVWNPDGQLHLFNQRSINDKEYTKPYPFEVKIKELFDKGALELDFNKRKEIYNQYQEIVADENPMIYLYSPLNIVAIKKEFKNIYPTKLFGLIHSKAEIWQDK